MCESHNRLSVSYPNLRKARSMRSLFSALPAALLALAMPACSPAPDGPETALTDAQIDERLAAAMSALEEQGFSGVAAAARNGEIIAFAQAGAADPESGRAYTPTTQFDIGSIVKPITGLAASHLIAQGRLDPEATLASFFDNVPQEKAGITVHQMLTHTAGLSPAHGYDLVPMTRDEMLAAAFAEELIAAPGERYSYSNTGLSLVAAIIEDITGKAYETHVREDILAPLGITDTGYRQAFDSARAEASAEYGPMEQATWGGNNPVSWALIGNGGMVSTVTDLATLGQAIVNGTIGPEVLDIWITPRVNEGGGTMYGYGIGWQEEPGIGPVYWHNGGNPAFQTEWWTIEESGITVILHRNGGPALSEALGPVLGAVTGGDMAFSDGPPDVELIAGNTLPDTPEGRLATEFLDAVRSDEAKWETFVRTRMSAQSLEATPVEDHVAMHTMLNSDIGARRLTAHGVSDLGVHLQLESETAPPLQLVLVTTEEDGEAKLNGLVAM